MRVKFREEQQNDRFQAQSQSSLRSYLECVRYQARVAPLVDVFAAVGLALVMWFGATHVIEGHLTTGDMDSLMFSGTIRENIAFGRPDASDHEIAAAAVVANAAEFIDVLPDGYETLVAESGPTLSGGQKQRIAFARAILRGSPILILDEATSGLDAASERTVIDALERAARGRTTLLIANRLITVRLADRIIVLDKGRIVEEGPHQELLSRRGKYARLYSLQLALQKDAILTLADGMDTLG
jgi:ABC-type multidrug transport system fused ATPase/permease subunit